MHQGLSQGQGYIIIFIARGSSVIMKILTNVKIKPTIFTSHYLGHFAVSSKGQLLLFGQKGHFAVSSKRSLYYQAKRVILLLVQKGHFTVRPKGSVCCQFKKGQFIVRLKVSFCCQFKRVTLLLGQKGHFAFKPKVTLVLVQKDNLAVRSKWSLCGEAKRTTFVDSSIGSLCCQT